MTSLAHSPGVASGAVWSHPWEEAAIDKNVIFMVVNSAPIYCLTSCPPPNVSRAEKLHV